MEPFRSGPGRRPLPLCSFLRYSGSLSLALERLVPAVEKVLLLGVSQDAWWPGLSPVNGTFCVVGTSGRNSTFIGIGSYGKKGTVVSEAQGAMCGAARARNGLATRPTGKKIFSRDFGLGDATKNAGILKVTFLEREP
jgi:hypothetical protein